MKRLMLSLLLSSPLTAEATEVRMYALAGTWMNPDATTCVSLFEKFDEQVRPRSQPGQPLLIRFSGQGSCYPGVDGNGVKRFIFRYTFEPMQESDVPSMEEYLAAHEGLVLFGNELHFERVFGVVSKAHVSIEFHDADDQVTELTTYEHESMHLTKSQADAWSNSLNAASATSNDLLDWIGRHETKEFATFLREFYFKDTNVVSSYTTQTLVLEDRRVLPGDFGGPYVLDCRQSESGFCL